MKSFQPSKSRLLLSVLLLVAVVLSACSSPTPTAAPLPTDTAAPPTPTAEPSPAPVDYSSVPIVGKTWYWQETQRNNETLTVVTDPAKYTVQFNADGTYTGIADCNNFAGGYTVEGSSITLQPGPMTLAACPEGSQADEYLKELNNVAAFLLQDNYLYLDIKADAGTMKFSEQPTAPQTVPAYAELPLANQVWMWQNLSPQSGNPTIVTNPQNYLLEFLPDGTLRGLADCNAMNGSFSANGNTLKIENLSTTKMACPDGSLDSQYTDALEQAASYEIKDSLLTITLADAGTMLFNPEPVAILPPPAAGTPSAQATAYVNVRSGPGTDYPVYGVMPIGTTAQVVGKNTDGSWWALSIPVAPLGQGWVSGQYVTTSNVESIPVLPAPPVPPTTEFTGPQPNDPQVSILDATYVRSGPGEAYPAYGVAPAGAKATVIGRSQDNLYWVVRINPTLVSTGVGWVLQAFTVAQNTNNVPVIESPPLPQTVAMPTPPAGAATGVALTALNVRSGPGTNYPVLAVAPAGSVGEITGKSADNAWWQVRVPTTLSADGFGWVSADYVYATNTANVPVVAAPVTQATNTPLPVILTPTLTASGSSSGSYMVKIGTTTETVNLRAGPGNQYESLDTLPSGWSGVIVGSDPNGTWYAFSVPTSLTKDGKGWVSASYVKVTEVNYATATAMATPYYPSVTATPGPNSTSAPPITDACKIIELKPVDGTVYKPNFSFDMKVVLENTSDYTWETNSVDVKFIKAIGNVPIHLTDSPFDLLETVLPDAQTTIPVDMKTPAQTGVYGETWALVQGSTTLCQWSFTVTVAK